MSDANPNELEDGGTLRAKFEAEAMQKDREIAFLKAGIDTDTPLGAMFARGYDGEIDAAKVKEAWAQVAPAAAPTEPIPTPATPPVPAADAAVFDEAGRLASGATPPGADNGPHPVIQGVSDYWDARRAGKTDKEAEALGFDRIFDAAVKGDPRVVLSGGRKGED